MARKCRKCGAYLQRRNGNCFICDLFKEQKALEEDPKPKPKEEKQETKKKKVKKGKKR